MPVRVALVACCILKLILTAPPVWPQQHRAKTAGRSTASPSPKSSKSADFSGEPYVIDRYDTTVRFESNGASERDLLVRVRIQNEEGAQRFREIAFAFNSANQKVEIASLTLTNPNGAAANAITPGATKEVPAAITRDSPAYSSYKEVHITLPSLEASDTLEYRVVTRTAQLGTQGEFWFQHSFVRDAVVLDERVELVLPPKRPFRIKSPGFSRISEAETFTTASGESESRDSSFTRTVERSRTILRWKHTNLTHEAEGEEKTEKQSRTAPPDIQLTSFVSWNDVARWYENLAKTTGASPAMNSTISAKTQELVKAGATQADKARALYDYVSQKIRSVSPPADFASLQPLPPATVLANGYGDSLDKHLLLAAMLDAARIPSLAALIPTGRKLDPDLPSPSQFDHVLALASPGDTRIWMDPAEEVAPFGFLPAPLRAQPSLLVSVNGTGRIVETPADPPFLSTQEVDLKCKLSELGKLKGTVRYSLRGDTEFVLRSAFRRTPPAQWNQIAQTILTLDGLQGEAVSVTTSDPRDTEKPFELAIEFSRTNALDWPNKKPRIALPLLTIAMPDPPAKATEPITLGSPLNVSTRLNLNFPPGVTAQMPIGMAVSRDYAEFKSSYRFEDGTLTATRSLNFKMRELPASRASDYLAFTHAVEADAGQALLIENPSASVTAIPPSATTDEVFETGEAALRSGDTSAAIALLKRASELEPQHKEAWSDLGLAQLRAGKADDAILAFRKQLEVNPSNEHANDYLGVALQRQGRNDEAAAAFRKQIELNPLDTVAHSALGSILLGQRDYTGAVAELEKAVILSPDNAILNVSLGRAYLNAGDKSKALDSLQKAVALSPTPAVRNDVAFTLAEQGVDLDKAEAYAESAIAATAANLEKAALARPTAQEFARVEDLGDYWDTLGWVYFRKGDLAKALRYVNAAWLLNQRCEVGDHLAQIYEKRGDKQSAIHTYAAALAARQPSPETRARLTLLLGGNAQIDDLVTKARPKLEQMRTFAVQRTPKEDASAEFFVLISPAPAGTNGASTKVDDVRFVNGSETLRPLSDPLKALDYGAVFPGPSPTKLIRRGILACAASNGTCTFTLMLPGDASR